MKEMARKNQVSPESPYDLKRFEPYLPEIFYQGLLGEDPADQLGGEPLADVSLVLGEQGEKAS
jgi:hypothetical protein